MGKQRTKQLVYLVTFILSLGLSRALPAEKPFRPEESEKVKAEEQSSAASTPESEPQPENLSPPHEEVTVTATRNPTTLAEIGNSITVIRPEEIRNAQSVSELLQSVPGFNVVQSGSFGSQTSLFVRGGESNFNLILVDGMQINSPGGAFDFADLSTLNIERIEIVRGPSSVLYGSEAVSSTINIITRDGGEHPGGSFSADGGSYNSYSLKGSVHGGSEKARFSLGGITSDTDGIYDFNSQYRRSEFSAKGVFELSQRSSLAANLRYSFSTQHFPTDGTGASIDPNDFRKGSQEVYSTVYQNQISDRYGTRIQYGYSRASSDIFTIFDGVTDFWDDLFETDENRHYIDWQNSVQLNSSNLLTAGMSFKREATHFGHLNRRSTGVFVQDQFTANSRLFITGGIRYENNTRFSSFTTGSLAVSAFVTDQVKLRASLGNGFRAPEFSQIIGFPDFGIQGNAHLKPEKNVATDVGIDFYRINGRGLFSATFFFNRFEDLIEFTFASPPGQPNYLNIEKARSQGLELEGSVGVTDEVRFGFVYTLLDTQVLDAGSIPGGEFGKGRRLLRRPAHSGDIYASFLRDRYRARLDLRYKGDRDDLQFLPDFSSSRVVLPGYWRFDLGLAVPIVSLTDDGNLALVLRGQNLLNKQYTEIAGFRSPGRMLSGGLEVVF